MLFVFLAAAVIAGLGVFIGDKTRGSGGPRPEGVVFVCAVLIASVLIFAAQELAPHERPILNASMMTPDSVMAQPLYPPQFILGLKLFLLTLAVYVLSALRGVAGFPAWIADIIVLGAAWTAANSGEEVLIQIARATEGDAPTLPLGPFGVLLTVVWIWLVSRLCASLNRAPSIAPGYLGLFAGTICLLLNLNARSANPFAPLCTAAISGAGLATFFVALKRPTINLGWSATLAMGFLLGLATSIGLLKTTLPAIVCLGVLSLGLPLLNVSIVAVRARLRGQNVEWNTRHLRLDEALAARGVAPRKIALFYFCLGAWLCGLAYLTTRWFFESPPGLVLGLFYAVVLLALIAFGAIVFFSIARVQMRRQPDEKVPSRLEAFGVEISPVSMLEALDTMEGFIREGTPHHVVTSDANAILTSKNDPEYAQIMRRAALITPDGFGVIWGARLLNLPIYERVTGVDMVTGLCERAAKHGYPIYILGSAEGVAATAAQNLMQRYPGLQVIGTYHGFWRRDGKAAGLTVEEADAKMADEIREAKPAILFVAMGIPMQEKFIAAQLDRMQVPVALGVGGSFDVYAGKFNRAPQFVQRVGLEWLYRVWIDPSRWRRMGYVPKFMMIALRTWLFGSKTGKTDAAF